MNVRNRELDQVAVYCLGRVEQFIEDYAKSAQVVPGELAERVAQLLHAQAGGKALGVEHQVPAVRSNGTANHQAVEPMALDDAAHRHYSSLSRYEQAGFLLDRGWPRPTIAQYMNIDVHSVDTYIARSGRSAKHGENSLKGYKYKFGTHWTQRPENKARLKRQMKRVRTYRQQ